VCDFYGEFFGEVWGGECECGVAIFGGGGGEGAG